MVSDEAKDKMERKVIRSIKEYDVAIILLEDFVKQKTNDINQAIQVTEGTIDMGVDIGAIELIKTEIGELERMRNNWKITLNHHRRLRLGK